MERTVKISALFLFLMLLAGSLSLNAQGHRNIKGFRNDTIQMRTKNDTLRMHMQPHMSMRRDIYNRSGRGIRYSGRIMPGRGMMASRGIMAHPEQGFTRDATSRRILESIPGITVKQQEELTKINEDQRKEMEKIREKNREELKKLQEDHRKKIDALLTGDQKKWLEEN